MDGPIRIGDTVRRPCRANTPLVQAVLAHLERHGVTWAPRALGIDAEGREVSSWIDGDSASTGSDIDMPALVAIVRELHDLTSGFVADAECVIHDDLQPRNVIVRGERPVGLIDWEQARPGRRVDDIANLCWSFTQPTADSDPHEIAECWRVVLDAYGLADRADVVTTIIARMTKCVADIERNAAAGSQRHELLARRGDHLAIRESLDWTVRHRAFLDARL
ncbi:MAG: phosphotransferase [Acidimicrobiia bacterium]